MKRFSTSVDAVAPLQMLAAGGFADGRGLADLALGAQDVRLRTRFLATVESALHPDFRQAMVDNDGHDTQLSKIPDIGAGLADVVRGAIVSSSVGLGASAGASRSHRKTTSGTRVRQRR